MQTALALPVRAAPVLPEIGIADDTRSADVRAIVQGLVAAWPQLAELLKSQDPRDRVTVSEIVRLHLNDVKGELAERSFENRERTAQMFARAYGNRLVADLSPLTLKEFIRDNPSWASGWTKDRVKADIQAVFNWAWRNRLLRENPLRGFTQDTSDKKTGRDMHNEEFRAILRHTDAPFRRLLMAMKLTGARPGELSALRWQHIDWRRGVATLTCREHKSGRKTGKPRVIVLIPSMLKLLTIMRRDQHGPAACVLRNFLRAGTPVKNDAGEVIAHQRKIRDVVFEMKQHGFSVRSLYRARQAIGATYRRVNAPGRPSDCAQFRKVIQALVNKDVRPELPENKDEFTIPEVASLLRAPKCYVHQMVRNGKLAAHGKPRRFRRQDLEAILADRESQAVRIHQRLVRNHRFTGGYCSVKRFIQRLRSGKLGPDDDVMGQPSDRFACTVYELRVDAKGRPEKATDHVFLCSKGSRWQRNAIAHKFNRLRKRLGLPKDCKPYGLRHSYITAGVKTGMNLKALATLVGHSTTMMIERVYCHIDRDIDFLQRAAAQAAGLAGQPSPLPAPVDDQAWEDLQKTAYPRVKAKPKKPHKPRERKLLDSHRVCYEALQFALKANPELATDQDAYHWLVSRPEYHGQLPPTAETFERYMHHARIHLEGAGKRKLRRLAMSNGNGKGGAA